MQSESKPRPIFKSIETNPAKQHNKPNNDPKSKQIINQKTQKVQNSSNTNQSKCISKILLPSKVQNRPQIPSLDEIKEIFLFNPNLAQTIDTNDIKLIDSGSSGSVWEARSKRNTKKIYAIKVQLIDSKHKESYISNEVNIGTLIKNKHILDQRGFYSLKGDYKCIVLDFMINGDLEKLKRVIHKDELSESLLCYITYQVAKGLNYMHTNKIAHLDIKPQNILIDENLNIRLADYSISYKYADAGEHIQLKHKGTIYYMSPEVMDAQEINTSDISKIDVWGVGVMTYYLYFNCYPFNLIIKREGEYNYKELYTSIQEKKLIFPKKAINETFKDFLTRCLEKDIEKRMSIAEMLQHEWVRTGAMYEEQKAKFSENEKFLVNLVTDNIAHFGKM
jgi:serine/threonine protein kinase